MMDQFSSLFSEYASLKVGIIGDVMLDSYLWGKVDRISPEAPVPIIALTKKEQRIGGAGNVALNCKSLHASVSLISVVGNDSEGIVLKQLLDEQGINTSYLLTSDERITTNKTRIIGRNQQMMRIDAEVTQDLKEDDEVRMIRLIADYVNEQQPQIIIFEDYNKGVLTPKVIESSIDLCNSKRIITAVDPKRNNFFGYQGVTIFKPNLAEVRDALQLNISTIDQQLMVDIHQRLHKKLDHKISLITLSEKGIFYNEGQTGSIIPSHIRTIADVSGAGDTVIAVASLVYAVTQNVHLMAEIANIAGGLVCEEVGTAAIDSKKLLLECQLLLN